MPIIDGYSLIVAQESSSLPLPGETGAPGAVPGGNGQPAGSGRPADPFGAQFFLIVFVVVAGMILFSILGQRRDRKRRGAMLSALKKHDKIQTIGGVIGSIVEVKKDLVVLKVDESSNTRISVARSAIQQVLSATEPAVAPAGVEKS